MNLSLIGFSLLTLGELLIGYTVIKVHGRISKEHRIDDQVLSEISRERKIAISGIVFIILGFILQLPEKFL